MKSNFEGEIYVDFVQELIKDYFECVDEYKEMNNKMTATRNEFVTIEKQIKSLQDVLSTLGINYNSLNKEVIL